MEKALEGDAVVGVEAVDRKALPFEYMLNATRLREGFQLQDFLDRTGLPASSLEKGLVEAQARGLIERSAGGVVPTERGFDFLSDLQALFLAD
jgi:oxygen-independent coproporphyrinogen-3 oxidase